MRQFCNSDFISTSASIARPKKVFGGRRSKRYVPLRHLLSTEDTEIRKGNNKHYKQERKKDNNNECDNADRNPPDYYSGILTQEWISVGEEMDGIIEARKKEREETIYWNMVVESCVALGV